MIPRYTRPAIGAVWTQQAKLETWLRVELAATEMRGTCTVIAGVGSNDTRHAVKLTERATAIGADALLSEGDRRIFTFGRAQPEAASGVATVASMARDRASLASA